MKSFYARLLITVMFLSAVSACLADEKAQKWDEAAGLYKGGKFAEAAAVYEGLSEKSSEAAEHPALYFNLGNCYYRTGDWSRAIWNFERAVALKPWYADARYNLNMAKSKLEYKIEDRRNLFMRFNSLVLQWVRLSDLLLVLLVIFLGLMISSLFWARGAQTSPYLSFPRFEIVLLLSLAVILLGSKVFYERNYGEAIVLAKEAEVRYGPALDNQSLMKLGGGLKVFIVDGREDWSRIVTWNGETGWIKNTEIGKVKS